MMTASLLQIPFESATNQEHTLKDFPAKAYLIVNVASKCGLTPQYEGLENLHRTYKDRGLVVMGFPANNFLGQEPGSNADIQAFCRMNYGVEFPVMAKISVKGPDQHPLYAALTREAPERQGGARPGFFSRLLGGLTGGNREIQWNFEKFLLGADGQVLARFASTVLPEDPMVLQAIDTALAS